MSWKNWIKALEAIDEFNGSWTWMMEIGVPQPDLGVLERSTNLNPFEI
jgi:hypothetical protein